MHVPQKLRKELKRKGTKALAFFLAFVLAVQCMNLPVIVAAATDAAGNALATVEDTPSNDQATSAATDQAADQAATETEQPATEQAPVEQPAEPAEPAEPATEEPAAAEAPAADQPAESTTPAGSENVTAGGASENGQAPVAPAADTTATVALSLAQSTLTVGAETYTATNTTMEAPANQELKFTVAPTDGFAVDAVKQVAADGSETELSADANGEYTIAADKVADGLKIDVATSEVPAEPAEEPADDAITEPTEEPATEEGSEEDAVENPEESDDTVTLSVEVENSTVTLTNAEGEEQKVSESQDVEVAADEDLALTVEPAEDYELESVTVTDAEGETEEVSGEDGVYTIPAEQVIEGSSIQVSAVTAARAQDTRATTANMAVGDTQRVTCNATGWHFCDWKSDNSSVADVTRNGDWGIQNNTQTVTAKKPGTANIFCGNTLILTVNVSAAKIVISFDLNGGHGAKPSSIEVEESGEIISLPDGEGITRNGYELLGWSTEKDSNTVTNQAGQDAEKPPVYGLGSAFEATESDTLYAVWAQSSGTRSGKIAIAVRYDGIIPSEPSLNNDSYKYLREGYSVNNVLDYFTPAHTTVGTSAVEAALTKYFYEEVESINRTSGYAYWDPDTQYVEWYVIKYQGNDSTWHIDGVCRQISKVNLDYDGNGNTGGLVPRGGQHDKGDTVTVSQPGANDYYGHWSEMVKSGYEFVGWLSSVDGETYQPGDSITVNENTTLTAQWQLKNNVRINYEVAGGVGGTVTPSYENLNPDTGEAKGSTATASEGYKFVGWYNNEDCVGAALSEDPHYIPTIPEGGWVNGTTFWAKFSIDDSDASKVKVDYKAENGTVSNTSGDMIQIVTADGLTGSSATANPGYKFDGWFVGDEPVKTADQDAEDGYLLTAKEAKAALNKAGNGTYAATTFTAKFSIDDSDASKVKVDYKAENGTVSNTSGDMIQIVTADGLTGSSATANPGYKFDGWFVGDEPVKTADQDAEDGYLLTAKEAKAALNKAGNGTYAATTFTAKFSIDDSDASKVKVDYKAENGTVSNTSGDMIQIVTADGLTGSSATANPGYKFDGWFVGDEPVKTADQDAEDGYLLTAKEAKAALNKAGNGTYAATTFTAKFSIDDSDASKVKVDYKAENGTVSNTSGDMIQIVTADGLTGSSATANPGYKFDGWFVGDEPVKTADQDAEDGYLLTAKEAKAALNKAGNGTYAATTFTAKFSIDDSDASKVKVDYKAENGTVSNTSGDMIQIVTADGLTGSSATANPGYKFDGWFVGDEPVKTADQDAEDGYLLTAKEAKAALNKAGNGTYAATTFTAKFSIDDSDASKVKVDYKAENGTVSNTSGDMIQIVTADGLTGSSATANPGYKFDGWFVGDEPVKTADQDAEDGYLLTAKEAKAALNKAGNGTYAATTFTAKFSIDDSDASKVKVDYKAENGTVSNTSGDMIQIVTADGLTGSSATANPGYKFDGWFVGDEPVKTADQDAEDGYLLTAKEAKAALNKAGNGTYAATTFTAKFSIDDSDASKVKVDYKAENGTVSNTSGDMIQIVTADGLTGSSATANPGYKFDGWFVGDEPVKTADQDAEDGYLLTAKEAKAALNKAGNGTYAATTFTAKFSIDDSDASKVKVDYKAENGTVSNTSGDMIQIVTADGLTGSSATANPGYKFDGWFVGDEPVKTADQDAEDGYLLTAKEAKAALNKAGNGTYAATTFTAKFSIDDSDASKVKVDYKAENGTVSNTSGDMIQIVTADGLTGSSATANPGYKFDGWFVGDEPVKTADQDAEDGYLLTAKEAKAALNKAGNGTYAATTFTAKFSIDDSDASKVKVDYKAENGTVSNTSGDMIQIVTADGLTGSSATANPGYKFDGWFVGDEPVKTADQDAEDGYLLTAKEAKAALNKAGNGTYAATTFTAKFSIDDSDASKVKVDYKAENGTVSNTSGDMIQIVTADGLTGSSATANPGYKFDGWFVGDEPVKTADQDAEDGYLLTAKEAKAALNKAGNGTYAATTFTAKFSIDDSDASKVKVDYKAENGTVSNTSGDMIQIVTADGLTGSSATANPGYKFDGWFVGDEPVKTADQDAEDGYLLTAKEAKAALNKAGNGTYAATTFTAKFSIDDSDASKVKVDYKAENGTVSNTSGDMIQIVTADGLTGSSATANPGYKFDGWFVGDEPVKTADQDAEDGYLLTAKEAKAALNKAGNGTYAATTFTAKFSIDDSDASKVKVDYKAENGTVSNTSGDMIQIVTADGLTGSSATANPGYKFDGWFVGDEPVKTADQDAEDGYLLTAKEAKAALNKAGNGTYAATTFTAKFSIDDSDASKVKVDYKAENGTVSNTSGDMIQIVTADGLTGSSATANPGYKFDGWFVGDEPVKTADQDAEDGYLLTAKEAKAALNKAGNGTYAATTFTAKFSIDDSDASKVKVDYKAENGTVSNTSGDMIQIVTADGLTGSSATANPGYKFDGWFVGDEPVKTADQDAEDGYLLTAKEAKAALNKAGNGTYAATTFTAKFSIDDSDASKVKVDYKAENGTVSNTSGDMIQIVTADGLTGSSATANPGYKFDGWFVGDEPVKTADQDAEDGYLLTAKEAKAALNKAGNGTYAATTFTAKFSIDDSDASKVKVDYKAENGTVSNTSGDMIQIVTADGLTGSSATANPGYKFDGWFVGDEPVKTADQDAEDGYLLTAKEAKAALNKAGNGTYAATTFTAKFSIDDSDASKVKVDYKAENGTVSNTSGDMIQIVTADGLTGSSATANPGYKFDGWFVGDEPVKTADQDAEDGYLLTAKEAKAALNKAGNGTYAATTFTAKFVPDFTDFEDAFEAGVVGQSWTYDASERTLNIKGIYPGDKLTYEFEGKTVEATVNAEGQIEGAPTFKNVADTASVKVAVTRGGESATGTASMTINPAELTITTPDATKVFDGTPLTAAGTMTGLVNGETAAFTTTGSVTNVDDANNGVAHNNTYTIEWNGTALEGNYAITENLGTLTVTAQSIDPGVDPDNPDNPAYSGVTVNYPQSVIYNGADQAWLPTVVDGQGNTLTYGEDYTVSYDGDTKNVRHIVVTIKGMGDYEGTVTREYDITPATITVRANNMSKIQGQADPSLTSIYEGAVAGEVPGWTGFISRVAGEAPGQYAIGQNTLALADGENGFLASNYTLEFIGATFTINPLPGGGDGGDGGTTPTTPTTPATPATPANPTPGPGATANIAAGATTGVVAAAATDDAAAAENIADDETPLAAGEETIDDDETPLASGREDRDCWVHWLMLVGLVISAVYYLGAVIHRRKFTTDLEGYEKDVLDPDNRNA